jgi:hypothetical protein
MVWMKAKSSSFQRASRGSAVALRLIPAEGGSEQIGISEAARLLHLCKAHVEMLCDHGELGPIKVTLGKHRVIARTRVLSCRERHLRERAALDEIEALTQELREQEHKELLAAASPGIRWTKASGQVAGNSGRAQRSKFAIVPARRKKFAR